MHRPERPSSSSKPVTATPSRSVTPAMRAPLARAWVMSDGLACPSVGRNAAPTTSSTVISGHSACASLRRQQLHLQAERVRRGRLPADLDPALGRAGEPQAAIALPARGLPGLGLQPPVELDRVAQQLGDVGAGAQLADQPGGMPGRARGQPALLQQQHVGPAELAQMIGHRAADDAAADDDDAGGGGQVGHRWTSAHSVQYICTIGDAFMPTRPNLFATTRGAEVRAGRGLRQSRAGLRRAP